MGGIFVVVGSIMLLLSTDTSAGWFDDAWQYRRAINFTHNAAIGSPRRVTITIDTATPIAAGKMQDDCDDVRFTDINGLLLQFQLTGACDNAATTFDVVFPTINNGTNPAYIYYGNMAANSASQDVSGVTSLSPSGGAPTIGPEERGPTPSLYLKFDEGQDTIAHDSSTNLNHGLISGATWQPQDMYVRGNCLWFNGLNNAVTVPDAPPIRLEGDLNDGFTVSGWVRANTAGEIFSKGPETYLRVTNPKPNGRADLEASLHLTTSDATLHLEDAITLNRWHHIAMTYLNNGSDEITFYIDGIARGTSINGDGDPTGDMPDPLPPINFPVIEATNTSSASGTGTTSHTVNLPTGIQAGDLLVIFFRTGGTSVTHTLSGWETLATRDSTGRSTIFWKIASGSEGGSASVTSGSGRASVHTSYRITGYDTSDPIRGAFTGSNTLDVAAFNPDWGTQKHLFIAMGATRRTDNTLSTPANYSGLIGAESTASNSSTDHVRIATTVRELEAASDDPVAFGNTGTINQTHSALVTINPAQHLRIVASAASGESNTGTTSHTVSLPSGIQADDLLVIYFRTGGTSPTHTLTGWETLDTRDSTGRSSIFYKTADGTEGASVTVSTGMTGRASAHISHRIVGYDPDNPIAGAFAGSQTLNPPELSPGFGTNNHLVVAFGSTRQTNGTLTAPSGFTNLILANSTTGSTSNDHTRVGVATRKIFGISADPGSFGSSGTNNTHAATIMVNPVKEKIVPSLIIGGAEATPFQGFIDEFKIYPYQRTAAQIKTDFIQGASASGSTASVGQDTMWMSDGLVGHWKLDEQSGDAADSSGNQSTLANTNDAQFVSGKLGNASDLDRASSQFFSAKQLPIGAVSRTGSIGNFTSGANSSSTLITVPTDAELMVLVAAGWPSFTAAPYYSGGTVTLASQSLSLGAAGDASNDWQNGALFYLDVRNLAGSQTLAWDWLGSTNSSAGCGTNMFYGFYKGVDMNNPIRSSGDDQNLPPFTVSSLAAQTGDMVVAAVSGTDNNTIEWTNGASQVASNFYGCNHTSYAEGFPTGDVTVSASFTSGDNDGALMAVVLAPLPAPEVVQTKYDYYDYPADDFDSGGTVTLTLDAPPEDGNLIVLGMIYPVGDGVASIDLPPGYTEFSSFVTNEGDDMAGILFSKVVDGDTSTINIDVTEDWIPYHFSYFALEITNVPANEAIEVVGNWHAPWTNPPYTVPSITTLTDNSLHVIVAGGREPSGSSASWTPPSTYDLTVDGNFAAVFSKVIPTAGPTGALTFGSTGWEWNYEFINISFAIKLHIPSNIDLSITEAVTLATWINPSSNTASAQYAITGKWDAGQESFLLAQYEDELRMYINSAGIYVETTGANLSTDTWYHVSSTYDAQKQSIKIFINGIEQATTITGALPSSIATTDGRFHIGAANSATTADDFYDGLIDDVRVYNRALTPTQIQTLHSYWRHFESEVVTDPGLQLHYKFDESTGQTAFDSSLYGRNGTLHASMNNADWVAGVYGNALDFDGNNDLVNTGYTTAPSQITISTWIYPRTHSTLFRIMDKRTGGSEVQVLYSYTDLSLGWIQQFSGGQQQWQTGPVFTLNTWNHVAVTYDNSSPSNAPIIYVNGTPRSINQSNSAGGTASTNSDPYVIGNRGAGDRPFDGLMDDFRIYDYIRTPAQIVEDMNATINYLHISADDIAKDFLRVQYKLDEGHGTTAQDTSPGSANNGTISNGTWTTNGKFNNALTFGATTSVTATIANPEYDNTLSLWVYPTTSAASKTLVTSGKLTTNGSSQPVYGGCTGTALPLDTWTHLVAVSDGSGSCAIYQNGIRTATGSTGVDFGTS